MSCEAVLDDTLRLANLKASLFPRHEAVKDSVHACCVHACCSDPRMAYRGSAGVGMGGQREVPLPGAWGRPQRSNSPKNWL